jgi:hypothetical protein
MMVNAKMPSSNPPIFIIAVITVTGCPHGDHPAEKFHADPEPSVRFERVAESGPRQPQLRLAEALSAKPVIAVPHRPFSFPIKALSFFLFTPDVYRVRSLPKFHELRWDWI